MEPMSYGTNVLNDHIGPYPDHCWPYPDLGVWKPPKLADIICEQPHKPVEKKTWKERRRLVVALRLLWMDCPGQCVLIPNCIWICCSFCWIQSAFLKKESSNTKFNVILHPSNPLQSNGTLAGEDAGCGFISCMDSKQLGWAAICNNTNSSLVCCHIIVW